MQLRNQEERLTELSKQVIRLQFELSLAQLKLERRPLATASAGERQ